MSESTLNPMGNLYTSFIFILNNMTIKYVYKANEYETLEMKQSADMYFDALNKRDTFLSYIDYTEYECRLAGVTEEIVKKSIVSGKLENVPDRYREPLLLIRRQSIIDSFEEKNNYYRCLNGYPDVEDTKYFYVTKAMATEYKIDETIPIHLIQDHYNKINPGDGDYYISIIEGNGYIDRLISAHPEKTYLKYLGSNRIDLELARNAKNFQIIQLKHGSLKQSVYDQFIQIYEQCREYFMKTIYIRQYQSFIEYYDNFIALSIMVMATQQMIMRQISLGVKREFFDIFSVKALYSAYNIPYNLYLDDETQSDIIQNLNLMIQDKATNKVIYNIANLLGFKDISVYKYYLYKERKTDIYGVPIVKYCEKFNTDNGTVEIVPDVNAMNEVYFQKAELKENDFVQSFNNASNKVDYDSITMEDPFWIEDENLYNRIWETEYNFVESKYLSLGISYSMTEMMFENVLLMKLLMQKSKELDDVRITLPRILENTKVPLFDVIILMVCLMACQHNLRGEIITIPTQVIHVLDYMNNVEQGDMLVDTISFDFDYFSPSNEEGQKHIKKMKELLSEEDYNRFLNYISILSFKGCHNATEKIKTLNEMYANIKGLYRFLNYQMTKTEDLETYECLKTMYRAAYYAKEMRDIFTITGEISGNQRTAWTYFEFLYHRNPKLYNAVFNVDFIANYQKYLTEHSLLESDFPYEDFLVLVERGEVEIDFDNLTGDVVDDVNVKSEKIYTYVNHIISRLQMIIDDLKYIYLISGAASPLEELLLKLVRFFKSYTVDVLGLDTLYICDLKPENMIRLFDKIHYMEKTIVPKDRFKLQHSDVIHRLITQYQLKDKLTLKDKMFYDALLLIKDSDEDGIRNSVRMRDEVSVFVNIPVKDKSLNLMDTIHNISTTDTISDSFKMNDKVIKMWYDEETTEKQ